MTALLLEQIPHGFFVSHSALCAARRREGYGQDSVSIRPLVADLTPPWELCQVKSFS